LSGEAPESGLALLAEALAAILYGRGDVEPETLAEKGRVKISRSLLSRGLFRVGLVDAYLEELAGVEKVAGMVLRVSGRASGEAATVGAGLLVGRFFSGDCVPVRVLRDVRLGRLLLRRGGYTCLREGVVELTVAGIVEPLERLVWRRGDTA